MHEMTTNGLLTWCAELAIIFKCLLQNTNVAIITLNATAHNNFENTRKAREKAHELIEADD